MSERFEDFMAGLVETAAAKTAPGPAAARKRSRQRRARQGFAASALVLALLGGAGGIAAANLNHDSGMASAAHSATPAPAASASATPSAAATTPITPSAAPSMSTNAATNPGSNAAVSLVPGTYAPGNWYNAAEVPLSSSTIAWVPSTDIFGTRIGSDVFEVRPTSNAYSDLGYFGERCRIASLTAGTTATEYEYYTGYDNNNYLNTADAAIAADANHLVYFYPDATSAATAWNAIAQGFTTCAGAETGVDPTTGGRVTGTTTRTDSANDAQCWSNVTTATGDPAGGGTSDHVCLVRQGDVIAAVDVSVNFGKSAYVSTVDYGVLDSTLLHDLAAGLSGRLYSGNPPVCASGDLKVALGPSGTYSTSTNGGRYQILVLTNIGGSACTVQGYPAAMLVDSSGKILNTSINGPQDGYDAKVYSQAQISLAPGATGSAILSWSNAPNVGICMYAGSNSLEVAAPYSTSATSLGTLTNVCDALGITPVQLGVVTP